MAGDYDPRLWIATDAGGIAAAFAHTKVTAEYQEWACHKVGFDGPVRLLQAVAVSTERQGSGLSSDAMNRAFKDILLREHKRTTLAIAIIDRRNERSRRMAQREGLEPMIGLSVDENDPHVEYMEYWYTAFGLGG